MRMLAAVACLLVSLATNAQTIQKQLSIDSSILSEQRVIDIYLPKSYGTDKQANYPVFYLLDGDLNGDFTASMLAQLSAGNGIAEHILVSIHSTDRLRDYAPTVNLDPRGPVGQGGGGDKFLDFVESELIPTINQQYRTTDHKVFAGHSVAGLLVIHSFQSRPKLFQAHLAFSPAVWWGAQETLNATKDYIKSDVDIGNFLYMNIGNENAVLRSVYEDFAKFMTYNRSLDLYLKTASYENASHNFTLPAGLYDALYNLNSYQKKLAKAP